MVLPPLTCLEITPDIDGILPPTDTRLRLDQRLLEEGLVEKAEAEKLRLEQRQRDTRKAMELADQAWVPAWFEKKDKMSGWTLIPDAYWKSRSDQFKGVDRDIFGKK